MINSIVLSGRFYGFNDDGKLLLKVDGLQNHQVVRIEITEELKAKLCEFVKEKDMIGVKGYIKLDEIRNIIIVD